MADVTLTPDEIFDPGRNSWRVSEADRASLIVDAAGYYEHLLHAMLNAREQIILIGWDVDTRIRLIDGKGPDGAPTTLGALITWIAKHRPGIKIYMLVWDHGLVSLPARGSTFLRMIRWKYEKCIEVKWDSVHPLAGSHHQKTVVIDDKLAFCGGIDITADRWDTREHLDDDPRRRRPTTNRRYKPWHDATMAVDGKAARDLGDLARLRWKIASGRDVPVPWGDNDPWPEALKPQMRDVRLGIARTRGQQGKVHEVREIEALFVDLIRRAKRFVYVETQYFASRVIAEAIADRLEEEEGPEFVIVNPREAYGWLDESVMSPARHELMRALAAKDRHGRFRIYSPVTKGGEDIYVHAKLMFVDDLYFRVGSANMNNRSMGLDSECDLLFDASNDDAAREAITAIRLDIIAEHFDCPPEEVGAAIAREKSLIGAMDSLRREGRSLLPLRHEEPSAVARKLARAEVFDPEAADQMFEARARPGLLSRLKARGRRRGR